MRKLIVCILVCCNSAIAEDQVPSNPGHFGCWEYVTTEKAGISNTLRLCVTADKTTLTVYFPNTSVGHGADTTCIANGNLAGFGEDGSRMYFFKPAQCSNERVLSAAVLLCSKDEMNLVCEDLDLAKFAERDEIEYQNTFTFSAAKDI